MFKNTGKLRKDRKKVGSAVVLLREKKGTMQREKGMAHGRCTLFTMLCGRDRTTSKGEKGRYAERGQNGPKLKEKFGGDPLKFASLSQ